MWVAQLQDSFCLTFSWPFPYISISYFTFPVQSTEFSFCFFPSFLAICILLSSNNIPFPVHLTGFSLRFFPGFLAVCILSSNNNNSGYHCCPTYLERRTFCVSFAWARLGSLSRNVMVRLNDVGLMLKTIQYTCLINKTFVVLRNKELNAISSSMIWKHATVIF